MLTNPPCLLRETCLRAEKYHVNVQISILEYILVVESKDQRVNADVEHLGGGITPVGEPRYILATIFLRLKWRTKLALHDWGSQELNYIAPGQSLLRPLCSSSRTMKQCQKHGISVLELQTQWRPESRRAPVRCGQLRIASQMNTRTTTDTMDVKRLERARTAWSLPSKNGTNILIPVVVRRCRDPTG